MNEDEEANTRQHLVVRVALNGGKTLRTRRVDTGVTIAIWKQMPPETRDDIARPHMNKLLAETVTTDWNEVE